MTVRNAMSTVLDRPIGPDENVARAEVPEWDSLRHVELMFSIEDACGVRFDEDELPVLGSLNAIVEAVERKRET